MTSDTSSCCLTRRAQHIIVSTWPIEVVTIDANDVSQVRRYILRYILFIFLEWIALDVYTFQILTFSQVAELSDGF